MFQHLFLSDLLSVGSLLRAAAVRAASVGLFLSGTIDLANGVLKLIA